MPARRKITLWREYGPLLTPPQRGARQVFLDGRIVVVGRVIADCAASVTAPVELASLRACSPAAGAVRGVGRERHLRGGRLHASPCQPPQ